ncbi:ABC transporter permease [Chloroflexota bacterium]
MQRYIIIRLLLGILTLVLLSIVVFAMSRATGDPLLVLLGTQATEEERESARHELGLDKPLPNQYFIWARDVLQGDLGKSIRSKRPVTELIRERFPETVKLAVATVIFTIPLGLVLGVLCAIKRNKLIDMIGRFIAVLGQSLPGFWVGIMLMLLFAVTWNVLPASGTGGPSHFVLPVITMGLAFLAGILRLTRSSMLEVLGSDYITFARAQGTPEKLVILKHALRNAAIPVITLSTVLFAYLLTGSIITETVFAWPGLGRLAYDAIFSRDFPVIQGIVLLYGAIFVTLNLLADLLYAWSDPRIRHR